MWIDATEAHETANNAVKNNTDTMLIFLMNKVVDAAKSGKYKVSFTYPYPLTFGWETIRKHFTDAGYQVSADISNDTFSFSIMW